MKIAPIIEQIELKKKEGSGLDYRLVHTGQHYDKKMSGDFFSQLGIPEPHVNLEAGSGSQAEQTAKIMVRYEKLLLEKSCDMTLVVGDVTSTMACAIAAKKLPSILVAHVEGGIRSFDMSMPEEVNRIVTDSVTDYFYTTSEVANSNLRKIGIPDKRILFVGNTMIDTLLNNIDNFLQPPLWSELNLEQRDYLVMTLHRPNNVDGEETLKNIIAELAENSNGIPMIFPVHPRTAKVLEKLEIQYSNLHLASPLSYLEFNYLVKNAKAVITDSGGITEETTVMGIPCMTIRASTERPETCDIGTNELLGTDPSAIAPAMKKLFSGNWKKGKIPDLWDGKTARRIVDHIESL